MKMDDEQYKIGLAKLEWIKQAFLKKDFSGAAAAGIDLRSDAEKKFDALPAEQTEARKSYAW